MPKTGVFAMPGSIRRRENMVGVSMVLAEFVEFKHGLYKSCGIKCVEGIMLEPCLLQPCFHVAGLCTPGAHVGARRGGVSQALGRDGHLGQALVLRVYVCMYVYIHMCIYIYIYIYREREMTTTIKN